MKKRPAHRSLELDVVSAKRTSASMAHLPGHLPTRPRLLSSLSAPDPTQPRDHTNLLRVAHTLLKNIENREAHIQGLLRLLEVAHTHYPTHDYVDLLYHWDSKASESRNLALLIIWAHREAKLALAYKAATYCVSAWHGNLKQRADTLKNIGQHGLATHNAALQAAKVFAIALFRGANHKSVAEFARTHSTMIAEFAKNQGYKKRPTNRFVKTICDWIGGWKKAANK